MWRYAFLAVFAMGLLSTSLAIEKQATEEKATSLLTRLVAQFSSNPPSVTSDQIKSLRTHSAHLPKGGAIPVMCELLIEEFEWYGSQSTSTRREFEAKLKALSQALTTLKSTKSPDLAAFRQISDLSVELRNINPSSACAIFYFSSACEVQLRRLPTDGIAKTVKQEVSYRTQQLGANSPLVADMSRLIARFQYDANEVQSARNQMNGLIASCREDDIFLAKNLAWTVNEIAESSLLREDLETLEWSLDKMKHLWPMAGKSEPVKDAIERLEGFVAVATCDIDKLISRGKSIDLKKVSSPDGIQRLGDLALALHEGGENVSAIDILQDVYQRLKIHGSKQGKAVGLLLAGLLASDEKWEASASVIEELKLSDDKSLTTLLGEVLELRIEVHVLPKNVDPESFHKLRRRLANEAPGTDVNTRSIDLSEASFHLSHGNAKQCESLLNRVKQADPRNQDQIQTRAGAERVKLELQLAHALGDKSREASCARQLEDYSHLLEKRRAVIASHHLQLP